MQPDELDSLMQEVFGRHWQVQLADLLDVAPTTTNRWARGKTPIPHWLTVLAWALVTLKRKDSVIPDELIKGRRSLVHGR
jgi:hypothetical protein